MPVAAAVGKTLVGLDALDEAVTDRRDEIEDFLGNEKADSKFSVPVTDEVALGPADLAKAREVRSPVTPYEGIGRGKPLTIYIESVYVGDYPDTMPLVPWIDRGDVLVTSAHKAYETFEAAPRAVHLLQRNAKPRTSLAAKASEQGSQLVYYSPAVTDLSTLLTVELSVDRELSATIGQALGKAVAAAGALPVFAPAAPYLLAAGVAIPIATKAVNMLARPNTFFGEDYELSVGRPGVEVAQPGALVFYGGKDDAFAGYKLGRGFVLREGGDGPAYKGPAPYVVISLDGTEREELEKWSSTAASAVLLERFFAPDELLSKTLDVVTDGMTLFNDMFYRDKAATALGKSKASKDAAERKKQQELYEAYAKNIRSKEIRESLGTQS